MSSSFPLSRVPQLIGGLIVIALLLSSCGSSSSIDETVLSNDAAAASTTPVGESISSAETSATEAVSTADVSALDGILVGHSVGEDEPYEIGTIDPTTGDYTVYAELPAEADITVVGPGSRLAPDLSRVAGSITESDGSERVGWYELDGNFTPVGPALENSAFAAKRHFDSAQFDWLGRLNYTIKTENSMDHESYALDPASGQSIPLNSSGFYGPAFLPNGQYAESGTCYREMYSFAKPNRGLFVDHNDNASSDAQIYLADFDALPGLGSCGPSGQGLLPAANVTDVHQPVMTRDQTRVAFYLGDSAPFDLYTVGVSGGQPEPVAGDWLEFTLLEWRS